MSSETETTKGRGQSETSVQVEVDTDPDTLKSIEIPGPSNPSKSEVFLDTEITKNKIPVAPVRKKSRKNLFAPSEEPPEVPENVDNNQEQKMEEPSPPKYEPREVALVDKPISNTQVQTPNNNSQNQISQPSQKYLPMEVYAAVVAAYSFLCIGLMRAYTSPAIASMKDDHTFFNADNPMSKTVISWVAASPPLASFFGTILSGLALQYCGRQKTLVLLTLPFIAGWLLIGFAKNTAMVMTGRALCGLAAGFATASSQLYVSECVRAKVRGFLGVLPAMMLSLGILLGFAMSTINLEWQEFALLMTCFPILLFLFSITVPESPSWLLMRGNEAHAIKSLKKLRGVSDHSSSTAISTKDHNLNLEIEKELEEMKRVIKKHHRSRIEDGKEDQEPQDFVEFVFKDLLGKREIWFPAFVSLSLMVFQQATGANAVIFYLSLILAEAAPENKIVSNSSFLALGTNSHKRDHYDHSGGGLDPNVSSVIVGLVQFFAFFLSLPLIDKLGRRVLLIASAILMIFPHLVLGIYFYVKMNPLNYIHVYKYESIIKYTSSWLPLTCLCGFIASYSIGFSAIPYIIMSEIFPSHARAYMCAMASLVNHLSLFFIIRVFPTLIDWIGPHVIFWLFAIFCFLAAVYVAIVVPETKGKTLAEIELEFMHKGSRRDSNSSSDISSSVEHNDKKSKKQKKGSEGKKGKKGNKKSDEKCNCKHDSSTK